MNILVYVDEGAGPRSVQLLIEALKSEPLCQDTKIQHVDRSFIKDVDWESSTSLLIFPGGRDIHYHEALKGKPNQKIRRYVENGGRYLGLCAGGYYGCSRIEFEKGRPLEVIGDRELSFFPGIARGSAYGPNQFQYESEDGSCVAELAWLGEEELGPASVYFNGGCAFIDANQHQNTSILARYQDIPNLPAAIVQCEVGKGKAILSGVHPEYCTQHIENLESTPKHLLPRLRSMESTRQKLFESLLMRLL